MKSEVLNAQHRAEVSSGHTHTHTHSFIHCLSFFFSLSPVVFGRRALNSAGSNRPAVHSQTANEIFTFKGRLKLKKTSSLVIPRFGSLARGLLVLMAQRPGMICQHAAATDHSTTSNIR